MCPILSLIPPRSLAENTSDPKSHCDLTTRAARGIFTVRSGYFLSGYPLLCKPCSDVHVLDDLIAHHLWHGQVRIPLALQALFGPVLGSWQRGGLTGSSGYPLLCKPCSDRMKRQPTTRAAKHDPRPDTPCSASPVRTSSDSVDFRRIQNVCPDTPCSASPVRTYEKSEIVSTIPASGYPLLCKPCSDVVLADNGQKLLDEYRPDTPCSASPVRTPGSNACGCRIGSRTSLSTLSATLCV